MEESSPTGWAKLFTPQAVQVTIPLDLKALITPEQASTLLQSVSNLIGAGFSVFAPGLEDGEQYEQVGFAVRLFRVDLGRDVSEPA